MSVINIQLDEFESDYELFPIYKMINWFFWSLSDSQCPVINGLSVKNAKNYIALANYPIMSKSHDVLTNKIYVYLTLMFHYMQMAS